MQHHKENSIGEEVNFRHFVAFFPLLAALFIQTIINSENKYFKKWTVVNFWQIPRISCNSCDMFWLRSDYASSQCRAIVHDLIITKALHLERHTVQWFTICNTKRDCIINKQGNAAALHCRSCHGWARGGWAASWLTSPQPFSALPRFTLWSLNWMPSVLQVEL